MSIMIRNGWVVDGTGSPAVRKDVLIERDRIARNKTLHLEEAIRKMTRMPAAHFGLRDRGVLRKGAFADVVVFDYENLENGATDDQPLAYARGVEQVIVNGQLVIRNAEPTGERPGRNLLRDPASSP